MNNHNIMVRGIVQNGDKDAAVAWWKLKDAAKYRVLYGDLRIEDADESQLPPAPSK